jgi:lipoprotein-anchoring transpeptidase ErfK/SrfK
MFGAFVLAATGVQSHARADGLLPPWTDSDDIPLPVWVHSVTLKRAEVPIVRAPGAVADRRGTPMENARLPLFAAKRAPGCTGRWLEVGPLSWVCSDGVNFSPEPPLFPEQHVGADGLPFRYFFVGKEGASGFANLLRALDDPPDQELSPGWAVGVTDERDAHGEHWGLTNHGHWISLKELGPAHPPTFAGEVLADGNLDVAWVIVERATMYSTAKMAKTVGTRALRDAVHVHETKGDGPSAMVRVSADGAATADEQWMRSRDLVRAVASAPPDEIGGATTHEKWIDVDTQTQTLVAYEGTRASFATLVSTGKGPKDSDTATRLGVHRIWVKLVSTNMGNLANEDADEHYSIEDVPWVQFFDKAIALHGAFWHRDFGHVHSHGCVNLSPKDSEWLFRFTAPHMPRGWTAVLPSELEPGTAIRVR